MDSIANTSAAARGRVGSAGGTNSDMPSSALATRRSSPLAIGCLALALVACRASEPAGEVGDVSIVDTLPAGPSDSSGSSGSKDSSDGDGEDASRIDANAGVDAPSESGDVGDAPAPTCETGGFIACDAAGDGACPACEAGTLCVFGGCGGGGHFAYCAPVPAECDGAPSCGCMGCECKEEGPCLWVGDVGMSCRGTTSRRDKKREIRYVDDAERAELADRALSIPLASYQYKTDPAAARRRLGFIIDDQPDPSFAVDGDRTHVDLYGYTSLLLATVQQQHQEIEAMQRRLDALEKR